jgi:hypothetical protein
MRLVIDVPEGYMVQVVPEEKSSRAVTPEWLDEIRPKFSGIDVDRELEKAKIWAGQHRRQVTRAFLTNWLNKQDPCFYSESAKAAILAEAEQIKARGHTDAMGRFQEGRAGDAAKLDELRKKYKTL